MQVDERHLKVLKLLEENPRLTQRALATELGISLGAANYCLKALLAEGWIKLGNFQQNPRKIGYLYLLTPAGIAAKTRLATSFLKRKLNEYEVLKAEIESLRVEVMQAKHLRAQRKC